ncbi:MAG: hypothetical protein Q8Q58_04020, partial [Candidatus Rokubacteria bacterium]|nr:hypothetical protein [Candidatus Rokubacteria bacterium]
MTRFTRRELLRTGAAGAGLGLLALSLGGGLAGCAAPITADIAPTTRRRVVVIGGGLGGATAAKYIRIGDPSIEVILLEPTREFVSCPLSNLVLSGVRVSGRRIAGTGGGQIGEAGVVVGNFLLDFPFHLMGRAWRVPSPQFRRLAEDGLRLHLATLGALLPSVPPEAEIRRRLVAGYEAGLGR